MLKPMLIGILVLMITSACAVGASGFPRLKVHPENPRWFQYGDRTIALFGSGHWTIISDTTVDIKDHNEWYTKYGANSNRASLFAFFTAFPDGNGLGPWKRTGPGIANDGLPRFDLTQWDERYWTRMHEYMSDCEQRGVILLLQMWDEPYIESDNETRWMQNPFNPENNVNDIPGLPRGRGPAEHEFFDPDNEALMKFQNAFIGRVLDETGKRYGNIIYEIGNEICMDSSARKENEWQRHWIKFFRNYEANHGVQLLLSNDTRGSVWETGADGFGVVNHHGFVSFDVPVQRDMGNMPQEIYECVRQTFDKYNKPVLNSRPSSDPDRKNYVDIVTDDVGRAIYWSYFCAGGHVIGFRTTVESWKDGLSAERTIRSVQKFARRLQLEKFRPQSNFASNGLCLADPGREYVVYLPKGGSVDVDLTQMQGSVSATWYNPRWSRDHRTWEEPAGARRSFSAPDDNDWVLHLVRK